MDPRFRGLGATGGVLAGVGASSAFWSGNGLLSSGATAADFITVYGVQVPDGGPSSVRFWTTGRECSTAFSSAVDGGAVLLAVSGDLLGQAVTCTLFGTEVAHMSMEEHNRRMAECPECKSDEEVQRTISHFNVQTTKKSSAYK